MASGNRLELLASQVIASDTTTFGAAVQVTRRMMDLIGVLEITARTDGTYTLSLEHSTDGSTWVPTDLATAASLAATGAETATVDGGSLGFIRAAVLSATTTSGATMSVHLYYEDRN